MKPIVDGTDIHVTLAPDTHALVKRAAAAKGQSVSQWMRRAALQYLDVIQGKDVFRLERFLMTPDLGNALACYGLISLIDRTSDDSTPPTKVVFNGTTMVVQGEHWWRNIQQRWSLLPVITTWSGGSGLYSGSASPAAEQAVRDVLAMNAQFEASGSPHQPFAAYSDGVRHGQRIVGACVDAGWVTPTGKMLDKGAVLEYSRSWLPESCLPWLDACWARVADPDSDGYKWITGPASGTGGNAGRVDFAALYARAVIAACEHPHGPLGYLRDLITDENDEPVWSSSPSSFLSAFAAQKPPVMNPWWLILAVEGMITLRPSIAHRLGGRNARPWPWRTTPKAYGPGRPSSAHYDLWLPAWTRQVTTREALRDLRDDMAARHRVGRGLGPASTSTHYSQLFAHGSWDLHRYYLGADGNVLVASYDNPLLSTPHR